MNIDRPKLAIATFATTLTAALLGFAFIPSAKVRYAFKAAWLGNRYLTIQAYDLENNRGVPVKLLRAAHEDKTPVEFTEPGPGVFRLKDTKKLFLTVKVNDLTRRLRIRPPREVITPMVNNQGPLAFRCKGMGVMAVPLEGVAVLGLPNPFLLLPRQESGALSLAVPKAMSLVFKSGGKTETIRFDTQKLRVVSMPVQPTSPLIFRFMMAGKELCKYTYYLEGRAKGMVMDRAKVLLNPHNPVFHARIRIIDQSMHLHCMAYARDRVSLKGPVAYRYLDMQTNSAMLSMKLPEKPGLYYVICTPDPVTPLFYYVRRNVIVGRGAALGLIQDYLESFSIDPQDEQTVKSLKNMGKLDEALNCLSSRIPDLLPPVDTAVVTLKADKRTRGERHRKAATVLMVLIGVSFAGITLWVVMASLQQGRRLRQALAEEGEVAGIAWQELALFVLINLVNVAVLLYTLVLVFL